MTRALNLAQLPGSTRETATYGVPRKPFVEPLPDLDTATDDEILDLAANCKRLPGDLYALCGSSAHVLAILKQVERLDVGTRTLDEQVVTLQRQLAVQQGITAALEARLAAEQERGGALHKLLVERDLENDALQRRLTKAAFELATRTITITNQPFDAVNAHLDSETHVVDVDGLDGPPPDRTPTLQDVPRTMTMAMVVGGGA